MEFVHFRITIGQSFPKKPNVEWEVVLGKNQA